MCVQLVLVLLVLVSATNPSQAQGGCPSCKKSKPFVTIGFYAKACARYPYLILIEDGIVAQGSGVCTTTGWTSTERILVDLKPNVPYTFSVDAGETCASHFNFYDIPEGYKLEIDGVETTTIDKVSNRGYGGNGDWTVVVREECDPCGSGPSGTPSGPDVGSVLWGVGLGNLSDGRSAGSLALREEQLTATSYTPDALVYTPPGHTNEVDVTQNANGNHRQIKVPESLADILVMSATEYEIRFYKAADVGSKDGSGLYSLTGSPYVTYTITNPNPATTTSLRISKSENGGPADVSDYTWDPIIDSWTLSRSNGARIETKVVSYPTDTSRTETFTVREGATVVSRVARTYHTYSFGEELVQEVVDPDGAALTTAYTYYEDPEEIRWHKIKSISYPDGSWVKYDYDNNGNQSLVLRPWKDLTLASATEQNARATLYTYSNTDGITTSVTPRFVSTITEKIAGIVVGSTTYNRLGTTVNGNPAVVETKRVYASANVSYATTTTTYHSTAVASLAERIASIEYPDGRKDTYTYEKGNYIPNVDPSLSQFVVDANGQAERRTITQGTTVSPAGVAFKTTRNAVVSDKSGNQVLQETHVYNGTGYERIGWSVSTFDGKGHATQTVRHNGQVSTAVWNTDRQTSGIDESGIETTYSYDSLGRLRDSNKKGIAAGGGFPAQADIVTTTIYDAEGHLKQENLSNGGSPLLSKVNTYDVAGRLKTSQDEAGLITSYTYTNGGRTQTVIRPGGATEVSDRYLDGQIKSITGNAVVATSFDYDVNADGTQFTQTFVGNAGLSSPRWTKTTKDWAGQKVKVEKPGFTGTNVLETSIYNALGQLQKQTTTANSVKLIADRLFEYDEIGRPIRAGSDINGDGSITLLSTDRLKETSVVYEKVGSDWFLVSSTKTYLTNNNATPAVQTIRERLNNFALNGSEQTVAETDSLDLAGNSTKTTITIDRTAKKQTVRTDTPDSNIDGVSISVNGLLQSSVATTPELATTYLYDSLGREISVTEPQAGTKTRSYNTSGQLASTNDGAGTTNYDYYPPSHANAGKLMSVRNDDAKKMYFSYNSRGEQSQNWGDTIYPVEFVYNSYGEKTEQHTFRGGQNWTSASWPTATTGAADTTTWTYQESTGLLTQKKDAALKGPVYTYDELGRVKTRTWARPITCTYNYDSNTGELLGIIYSDATPSVTFTYDRGGRQASVIDAAGTRTRTFSVMGEPETEQITAGTFASIAVDVGYDGFLRKNSLQTMQGANTLVSQTYGYDLTSRLETITSGSQTVTYSYYPNSGLPNATTFTGGTSVSRNYDNLGRLEVITTTPAADVAQSYTYLNNNLNQRTRITRQDGSYWIYLYNDRGEVISGKKYWPDNAVIWGAQSEYSFDNIGNRISIKAGGNQVGTLRQSSYTVNSLNQYVQRTVPGAVDITGTANNAAVVSVNDQSTSRKADYFYKELTVDNSAAPVYPAVSVRGARNNFGPGGEDAISEKGGHIFLPQAAEAFSYDDDGNLLSDGRWNYTWDAENRLTSMQAIAAVPVDAKLRLEFAYDHKSRRIEKKVYVWNTGTSTYQLQFTRRFVYDGWNLTAELDGNNTLLRTFVWGKDVTGQLQGAGGMGGLLLINDGPNTYQAGFDGNENVIALVKASDGHLSASYEYGPFGEPLRTTGEYAEQNPFRFSSVYSDQETGLLSYAFRYYNPQTGSWLGRDPLEEAGGVNLSQFVYNNPLDGLDVLGLGRYNRGTNLPPPPPPDAGSGAHGDWKPYWRDYVTYQKWFGIATASATVYPDASAHMFHYLKNSGSTLQIKLKWMIMNSEGARLHFYNEVNDAMDFVEWYTTLNNFKDFHIVGTWTGGQNAQKDSSNWFYAVGGYSAVGSAHVKVLPNCDYEMQFTFTFADRYNWDVNKGVLMLGKHVKDQELGRLHKVGLAQEYDMTGSDTVTVLWKKGQRFNTNGQLTDQSGRTGR